MGTLFENIDWIVTDEGMISKPQGNHQGEYFIEKSRLRTSRWFAHLSEKIWWNAETFADAYYFACSNLLGEKPCRTVPVSFNDYRQIDDVRQTSKSFELKTFQEMSDEIGDDSKYPQVTAYLTEEDSKIAKH